MGLRLGSLAFDSRNFTKWIYEDPAECKMMWSSFALWEGEFGSSWWEKTINYLGGFFSLQQVSKHSTKQSEFGSIKKAT